MATPPWLFAIVASICAVPLPSWLAGYHSQTTAPLVRSVTLAQNFSITTLPSLSGALELPNFSVIGFSGVGPAASGWLAGADSLGAAAELAGWLEAGALLALEEPPQPLRAAPVKQSANNRDSAFFIRISSFMIGS